MSFDAATDRRLNLPEQGLKKSKLASVCVAVADVRSSPDLKCNLDTQFLFGSTVSVFPHDHYWVLAQSTRDGYVGFVEASALNSGEKTPTHRLIVPRSMRYSSPDMKTPRIDAISIGSMVCVTGNVQTRGTEYAMLDDGSVVIAQHLAPVSDTQSDVVGIAETLIHAPYLWGGVSAFGIDCSGLVQLCFAMCGIKVLRDTDMQCATIGRPVLRSELQRGDLIFWKGHVAFYRGDGTIIHANGHSMSVAIEGLEEAINRIAYLYGQPTAYKRA